MYASVRKYQATDIEMVIQKIKEEFQPQISQQLGFIAYFVVQAENGGIVSVSVFETESQAAASNRLAADFVKESSIAEFLQPPEISTGEIISSKVKGLPDWVAAVLTTGMKV